jgi:fermentation-respiration switch protein FrsA (DUF1100 family)
MQAAPGLTQTEEVELRTTDGETLIAWHIVPPPDKPVVIYFQGNGAGLRERAQRFVKLKAAGFGVLAISYRGYGGSSGRPTEEGLLRDAEAAWQFASSRYGAERVALWGESLGTGVAVALAAERPVARIVLEAPFTSTADVAASIYWFLPVRLLMHDQFRSDQRIAKVTAPTLVIHGDRDEVVSFRFGERLYAMIHSPKKFVRIAGAGHNDKDQFGATDTVIEFLSGKM